MTHPAQVLSQGVIRLFKHLTCLLEFGTQFFTHPGILRSLSREN
jgi:hypothetical protein